MRELIAPNLHAAFIHIPVGLLLVGTVIELFAFLWRESSFRVAGRWMILVGALTMIPAATTGLYAARDVMRSDAATWAELKSTARLNETQWDLLGDHLLYTALGTALAIASALSWVAASDACRRKLHWVFMIVLLIGVGLMLSGAWHAGEMVYTQGVAVSTDAPAAAPADATTLQKVDAAIEPMQWHLFFAGTTVALSLAALALSARAITVRSIADENLESPAPEKTDVRTAFGSAKEFTDALLPFVPSARFWVLACLVALLTAAGGIYLLGSSLGTCEPKALWESIADRDTPRRLAHAAIGAAIILLPLILSAVAKWAPRSKLLLITLSSLLLLAVAAQVWFGMLMLFDSCDGPVFGANSGS